MSEELQRTPPETQPKWSRQKLILTVFAAFLIAGAILFQLAAGKVRQAAEQSLLTRTNDAVNGQITVGSIDLSILGYVNVKNVRILNVAGQSLASISQVHIRYNWSDLLKGQLGPQLIKEVILEKPEFWLSYRQDRLNWENIVKPSSNETPTFAGQVKVQDGRLHLESDWFDKTVEQLSGKFDFQQANQIGFSTDGKLEQAAFSINGQWGTEGTSEITVALKGVDLVKSGLTTSDSPLRLTAGLLDDLSVKIAKDNTSGAVVLKTLSGSFSGVATAGALALTQTSASFEKQGTALLFTNGQTAYKNQAITVTGRVLLPFTGDSELDLSFEMPSGEPAALMPNLKAGGPLTAQGKITGSALSPVLSGNFSLGSLQFGDMAVSGITGTFAYNGQVLKLLSSSGSTLGGSVSASGDVLPDTDQFNLSISGSNLNTSQLTEKDVKGPLSFGGTANGSVDAATLQGQFTIYNGKAYGIAFHTLTGNFIKRGSAEADVSNLAISTDFGTFYPEQINQTVMEKLQQRQLPTNPAELREKITEKVTQKVFEKIFH